MFICPECGTKRGIDSFWQEFAPQSRGPCELCGKHAVCADIHHSQVPSAPANPRTGESA